MRKILFFLLSAIAITFTGCQSEKVPVADDEIVSSECTAESISSELSETSENTISSTTSEESIPTPEVSDESSAGTSKVKDVPSSSVQEQKLIPKQDNNSKKSTVSLQKEKTENPENPNPPIISEPEPPEKEKSIYDAPFDIEKIRQELIQIGVREMGWEHRTHYQDGELITPNNSSWDGNIVADQNNQGERLKRLLHDYITLYTDEFMKSYGGEPITAFTIYIEHIGGDTYTFYLLH